MLVKLRGRPINDVTVLEGGFCDDGTTAIVIKGVIMMGGGGWVRNCSFMDELRKTHA